MTPDTRAFLDEVRRAEDPSAEDEARVLAAVRTTVTVGAAAGAAVGVSKLGKLWALLVAPSVKIGVLAIGVSGAALGVGASLSSSEGAPPPPQPQGQVAAVAASVPVASARVATEAPPPKQPEVEPPPPEPAVVVKPPPRAAASAPPEVASLRRELEHLAAVQRALQQGDAEKALKQLDEHETSDAQLLAERRAARVLALCAAGRVQQARRARSEFLAAHPASPQRAAVEGACVTSTK